jgi:hypothetical protein
MVNFIQIEIKMSKVKPKIVNISTQPKKQQQQVTKPPPSDDDDEYEYYEEAVEIEVDDDEDDVEGLINPSANIGISAAPTSDKKLTFSSLDKNEGFKERLEEENRARGSLLKIKLVFPDKTTEIISVYFIFIFLFYNIKGTAESNC